MRCRTHRLPALAVVALLGLAGCGDNGGLDLGGGDGTETTDATGGPDDDPQAFALDAELVAFGGGGSGFSALIPAAVLRSAAEVRAWAGWFQSASPELADAVRDLEEAVFDDEGGGRGDRAVVSFAPDGCAEVDARLVADGDDLGVELLDEPGAVFDCDEPVQFVAAFAVDAGDLGDVTLGGEAPPEVVGPGRPLDLGLSVDPDGPADEAVDVGDPAARAALAAAMVGDDGQDRAAAVNATLVAAVDELGDDERLLVALPGACDPVRQELVIGADAASIEVIEGETLCEFSPPIVAAMVVAAELLPGS